MSTSKGKGVRTNTKEVESVVELGSELKYSKGLVVGETENSPHVREFIRRQEHDENISRNELRKARKINSELLVMLFILGIGVTAIGVLITSIIAITIGVSLAVGTFALFTTKYFITLVNRRKLLTLEEEIKESKVVTMFKVLGNINNREFSLKGDINLLLKYLNTKYKTKDSTVRLYEVLGVEGSKVIITEDLYVITKEDFSDDKYSYELEFLDAYKLYKRLKDNKRDNMTASEYLGLDIKEDLNLVAQQI